MKLLESITQAAKQAANQLYNTTANQLIQTVIQRETNWTYIKKRTWHLRPQGAEVVCNATRSKRDSSSWRKTFSHSSLFSSKWWFIYFLKLLDCSGDLRCCDCVDECRFVPFWWCTSAWWRRTLAACAPRGLCSRVFSPYKSWPASAPTWTLPPGASALCPCCRSQRCVSGRSPAVSWSPTGRRVRVV